MTQEGYLIRLSKCQTQVDVDLVVKTIASDPEISDFKMGQLMKHVDARRAELRDMTNL